MLPAYNEEANIESVIKQWHPVTEKIGEGSKLIIIDDGSKDSTYSVMQKLAPVYPNLLPMTKQNSGHGATCLYAYRYAIDNDAEYVFQTDSDGQTDPAEFDQFWQLREGYDLIVGSRKGRQDGVNRVLVTKVLKLVVRVVFGVWVEDANTPFRLIRVSTLKKYFSLIPKDFFLSNILLSCIFVIKKERCCWIPITFKPRQGGVNSINLKRIFKIGIKALKDFREANKRIRESS